MIIDRDAAFFPGVDHLILADPFVSIHDAIMRRLVQVNDVFEADVKAFVMAAEAGVLVVTRFGEIGVQFVAVMHLNLRALEQQLELLVADVVMFDLHAHSFHDVIDVLLADEHVIDHEATPVDE